MVGTYLYSIEQIMKLAFCEKAADPRAPWIRTSPYLSSAGVALRFLARAGWVGAQPEGCCRDLLERTGWEDLIACEDLPADPLARFLSLYERVTRASGRFDRHRMLSEINRIAGDGGDAASPAARPVPALDARGRAAEGGSDPLARIARELIIQVGRELAEVIRQTERALDLGVRRGAEIGRGALCARRGRGPGCLPGTPGPRRSPRVSGC